MGRPLFVLLCVVGRISVAEDNPHTALLAEFDVKSDTKGIGNFLRELQPSASSRQAVERLITQLGDDDYFRRESASKQLLRLPVMPLDALRSATRSDDPEIRWRAKEVLAEAGGQSSALIHAALKTVEQNRLQGLAEPILKVIPLCNEEYLLRAAREALQATTSGRPEDAGLLRAALNNEQEQVRIAAIGSLAQLLGPTSASDLAPLLDDASNTVRLAAARAIGAQQLAQPALTMHPADRRWLETLGLLLEADEVQVRAGSIQLLRTVTDQQIPFTAYDDEPARAKAALVWQEWIAGPGQTASLRPVKDQPFDIGRLLICYYGHNKVVELSADQLKGDSSGVKPTWQYSVPNPWACQGLPNGHRLIASYNGRFIVEYDADGKEVWRKDGLPGSPFSVQRLENGNTLLACSDGQKVVEIDRAGEEVWSHIIPGRPMDARRLENGRTLITLQQNNQVIEVDQAKNEKWKLEGVNSPLTAQRLDNGNTLVCETSAGRVGEYDRDKKMVWSHAGLNNPYDAQRLPSGNTVISDNRGVREVNTKGETVWEIVGNSVSRISRF